MFFIGVPPIRFPGFTEPWQRCFLSSFLQVNKERNRSNFFSKNDVLSVSGELGIVNQIELLGRSFAGKEVVDYHIVRNGNVVYTKSPLKEFPYGIIKVNRGVDGIVSTLYAVYNVQDNADGRFIENYFSDKSRINRYLKPIVRIGAKHDMKIGNDEVLHNYVFFPSHNEQRHIAGFLDLLDRRIAVQNKIIEQLQSLMGGIIDGSLNKRKYRLSHFSSEWKSKKLGDLGVFVRGLSYDNNSVVDDSTQTLVIRSNNISQGKGVDLSKDVVYVDKAPEEEQMLQECDIVFCMANGSSALVGKNSVYFGNYNGAITVGAFCGIYRGTSKLTRWMLNSNQYQRTIYNLMQGGNGAIANLKGQDILDLSFDFPSENEEEIRLDTILSSIEKIIVIEERLLKLYVTQKQHLLSQMFI